MNLQQRLEATVGQAESDAGLLHDIVHGDADTEVQTEGGPIKTVQVHLANMGLPVRVTGVLDAARQVSQC